MTAPPGPPVSTTAVQLLVTAERLFGEHGIAGVSLRQIGAAAGSSNNSAVHYHFGSKEQLIEAIFSYRLPHLLQRRHLLKARAVPGDLRSRLEAHLLPILELAESRDSSYLSFLEQLERHHATRPLLVPQEATESQSQFVADLQVLLDQIDEAVRTIRIPQMQMLSLHTAAERERAVRTDEPVMPFGLFVSTLIDGCVGFLTGPVSAETKRLISLPDHKESEPLRRLI